jgi:hypothetical protein
MREGMRIVCWKQLIFERVFLSLFFIRCFVAWISRSLLEIVLRGEGDVVAWGARVGGPQPPSLPKEHEAADATLKRNLATAAAGRAMQWQCSFVGRDVGGNRQQHPRR